MTPHSIRVVGSCVTIEASCTLSPAAVDALIRELRRAKLAAEAAARPKGAAISWLSRRIEERRA